VLSVLRVVLGAVFIYAAHEDPPGLALFRAVDRPYQMLPEWAACRRADARGRSALGILLVAGIWLRYLFVVATGILGAFFAIMVVHIRGATIDCGCFGVENPVRQDLPETACSSWPRRGSSCSREGSFVSVSSFQFSCTTRPS
jgi:hypothetical protein